MTVGDQLFLLAPSAPRHEVSTDSARVLTFNAQHSSPARAYRQAEWIGSQKIADLVVITEVGPGPGGAALIAALADYGYASVLAPKPATPDYRTVIASRSAPLTPITTGIDVLPHRGPAATVTIAEHTVLLLGLYVPSRGPRERRNEDKRAFQKAVTADLPALVDQHDGLAIVTGDLNVLEPDHSPRYSVFGEWEYDFYRSFAQAGLIDAYRHKQPATDEYSWFGRGGNGYRFDHCFITAHHRSQLTSCEYLHEPRTSGLTDHSAMALSVWLS